MPLSAVFFDLDGTLLDTAPDFITAVNQLTRDHQLPEVDSQLIRQYVSRGGRAITELVFQKSRESEDFDHYLQLLLDAYEQEMGKHCVLFEGMEALLEQITRQQMDWGIITNKPARFAEPLIAKLNFPSPPAVLLCPDHVSKPKPDAEPLLLACEQTQNRPEQVLYIGDHLRDIESGRNAGCLTMAVAFGYLHDEDDIDSWGADIICETGHDIWPAIQTLLS